MNFAALPPEINSGLMYTGLGSGPMLAAAAAWDGLATELRSAATAYQSVITGLIGESWLGPSSATMAAAATPYAGWLAAAAAQAEQTANQALAAVAAYEEAFAMTVPPPAVAANRVQLAVLVATNVFGQNAPAIAATEAHYGEMWAQDAATMYGYASSAGSAAKLTPFAPAPAGPAAQAAQAVSLASLIPTLSLAVASSAASVNPSIAGSAWNAAATNNRILVGNTQGILDNGEELHIMESEILQILRAGRMGGALPTAVGADLGAGLRAAPVSAARAQAVSAGKLSVPLSWAAAAPEIRTVAYALPAAGAATAAAEASAGGAFSQMALAGMGGSALAGSVSRGQGDHPAAIPAARVKADPGEPAESTQEPPESPVAGLVTGLRQLGELRDSGLLTVEEFAEQKQRLLYRPLR